MFVRLFHRAVPADCSRVSSIRRFSAKVSEIRRQTHIEQTDRRRRLPQGFSSTFAEERSRNYERRRRVRKRQRKLTESDRLKLKIVNHRKDIPPTFSVLLYISLFHSAN